jgi:hypothetical protein
VSKCGKPQQSRDKYRTEGKAVNSKTMWQLSGANEAPNTT